MQNCPDVTVEVVIKSNEDWPEYIDSVSIKIQRRFEFLTTIVYLICGFFRQVCRAYGFYQRSCPFVYTIEGELIGDGPEFEEHVRNAYNRAHVQISEVQQADRARGNLRDIEEKMRFRKHGETLGQNITSYLQSIKKKKLISHIGDSFFRPTEENGSLFQLRRTNLQRDDGGRTLNIEDEIEVEAAAIQAAREEEEKKDMTFEQFMASF